MEHVILGWWKQKQEEHKRLFFFVHFFLSVFRYKPDDFVFFFLIAKTKRQRFCFVNDYEITEKPYIRSNWSKIYLFCIGKHMVSDAQHLARTKNCHTTSTLNIGTLNFFW